MSRFLGSMLMLLVSMQAMAQKAVDEAPSEQASPVVVWAFLIIFVGGCIAFPIYLWWKGRNNR